jgi:hypothetical protein
MKHMKGGFIINENLRNNRTNDAIFMDFLNSCQKAKVISDSSISGIIVHMYDCPINSSPYVSMRNIQALTDITGCIIKLNIIGVCLDNKKMLRDINSNLSFTRRPSTTDPYNGNLEVQSFKTFNNEVVNTQNIFKSSFSSKEKINGNRMYLDPICPSIIAYCDTLSLRASTAFIIDNISQKIQTQEDKDVLQNFCDLLKNLNTFKKNNFVIGFIAQEMMDGYKPLYEFRLSPLFNVYKIYAKFQLMRLSINHNIRHDDAHHGNVMINPNVKYFKGMHDGAPILIDFGRISPYNAPQQMSAIYYPLLDNYYNTNSRYGDTIDMVTYQEIVNAMLAQNQILINTIAQQFNMDIPHLKATFDNLSLIDDIYVPLYGGGGTIYGGDIKTENALDMKILLVDDETSQTNTINNIENNLKDYDSIDKFVNNLKEEINYNPFEMDDCYLCFNQIHQNGGKRKTVRRNKKRKLKSRKYRRH